VRLTKHKHKRATYGHRPEDSVPASYTTVHNNKNATQDLEASRETASCQIS